MPRHIVCLTFDFDTQSGFIARGLTTQTPLSRGEFGSRVASGRLLDMLKTRGLPSTWYVPGFTIESHPRECEAVLEGGHEIAHHSWAHIPPAEQTRAEEEADMVRANQAIERLTGQKARGYRSPSWDLSDSTIDLLIENGFLYDSSLMGADYIPYRARRKDTFGLGEPYQYGAETSLIEMPISWSLDDYPHFEFVRTPTAVLPGLMATRGVLENWIDDFRYMTETLDWGVITYTCHPLVIGRGHRMMMLERLIKALIDGGAVFLTMESAAAEFAEREPAPNANDK